MAQHTIYNLYGSTSPTKTNTIHTAVAVFCFTHKTRRSCCREAAHVSTPHHHHPTLTDDCSLRGPVGTTASLWAPVAVTSSRRPARATVCDRNMKTCSLCCECCSFHKQSCPISDDDIDAAVVVVLMCNRQRRQAEKSSEGLCQVEWQRGAEVLVSGAGCCVVWEEGERRERESRIWADRDLSPNFSPWIYIFSWIISDIIAIQYAVVDIIGRSAGSKVPGMEGERRRNKK